MDLTGNLIETTKFPAGGPCVNSEFVNFSFRARALPFRRPSIENRKNYD